MPAELKLAPRYLNAEIRAHLASQYMLGTLIPASKRRFEVLIQRDPEWEREVFQWQSHLEHLHMREEEVIPPTRVWVGLAEQLAQGGPQRERWWQAGWQSIAVWRSAALLCTLLLLALSISWQPVGHKSASYIALMGAPGSQAEPLLILAAYKGNKPGQSRLEVQWNKRQNTASLEHLTLWSVDRASGEQRSLGLLSGLQQRGYLSAGEWKLIMSSVELVLTRGDQMSGDAVVYRGPCLQLSAWAAS